MNQLDALFNPSSVAVIGASGDSGRIGYNILESIVTGGFPGPVYPVNGKYQQIMGLKCYPDLSTVPEAPDLAILAVNQYATIEQAELCAKLGVKGIVCPAGGFKEMGEEGKALEERLRRIALEHGFPLVGPNTLGLINTHRPLYATFYPMKLKPGKVSVVSQSGGMGLSIIALMEDEGIGVAKWCGVGNRGSLEFADYIKYLADDPETGVIGIFMEGTEDGRAFVQAAAAVREKPVVIFKGSRGMAAAQAAKTHTGTLAGSYRIYQDIFAQHRLPAVDSVEELVYSLKSLAISPNRHKGKIGVITHTAGPGIVAADVLEEAGCSMPDLTEATIKGIEEIIGPNPPVILRNPLDLAGAGFAAPAFGGCALALAKDPDVEGVLAIYCHHRNWDFPTRELIEAKKASGGKPFVICYIGQMEAIESERAALESAGIPLYSSIKAAALGLAALKSNEGRA